jgi:hypothetical protein
MPYAPCEIKDAGSKVFSPDSYHEKRKEDTGGRLSGPSGQDFRNSGLKP